MCSLKQNLVLLCQFGWGRGYYSLSCCHSKPQFDCLPYITSKIAWLCTSSRQMVGKHEWLHRQRLWSKSLKYITPSCSQELSHMTLNNCKEDQEVYRKKLTNICHNIQGVIDFLAITVFNQILSLFSFFQLFCQGNQDES